MKFKNLFPVLALLLLLAGCTSTIPRQATHDSISKELDAALKPVPQAAAKPDITQSLLPPLLTGQTEATRQAVEPRFDLSVSGAAAPQVFLAIVSGTRYSVVLHPEVKGEVTVDLKNVTVREALDTLRDLYGYEYKLDGNRIAILPNTLQVRLFQVNYLAGKRQGMTDMRVSSSAITSGSSSTAGTTNTQPGGHKLDASRITTNFDNDFWAELKSALAAVVGSEPGRNVLVNPLSGVVIVRALPAEIRSVEAYLRATQLVIERQVMLEAKIIEVALNDSFQTGINWALAGSLGGKFLLNSNLGGATFPANTGTTTLFGGDKSNYGALDLTGTTSSSGIAFQSSNFAAVLQFLETQGDLQVLSSPRIATLNNQKAVLKVGTDEFFVTNVSTTTSSIGSSSVTSPTLTLEPYFSGITLDVTPQIDEADNIILHVHPSISDVTEQQKVIKLGSDLGDFTLPLASSKINETDSIVRVTDGNIVAIGGLFTQVQRRGDSGLPGVSGKVGIGDILGKRSNSLTKGEIVILIKPTIIQDSHSWQAGLDEVRDRMLGFVPKPAPDAPLR